MRILDFIAMLIISLLLITGLYLLWQNLPGENVKYKQYEAQISQDLPIKAGQFYSDMRYPDKEISYYLSISCSSKKKTDFKEAVELIESKTILNFVESTSNDAQITITCSNLAPEPQEEGHFIAGEGGPSIFLNTSRFAIIMSGKIALYRPETCGTPQIATHELLHALGFDHNSNKESIMYPITNCGQKLDQYIIDDINNLYATPSLPDLEIESVQANQTGRYLNFDITISNLGLKSMKEATLEVLANSELVKEFEIGEIDVGAKRHLSVTNLRLPRNIDKIVLSAKTTQSELSLDNNEVEIGPAN